MSIDRASKTITDEQGVEYRILPHQNALPDSERAVMAVGGGGSAAVEVIIVGERSFVSSKLSVDHPNAYIQTGTCAGFKSK